MFIWGGEGFSRPEACGGIRHSSSLWPTRLGFEESSPTEAPPQFALIGRFVGYFQQPQLGDVRTKSYAQVVRDSFCASVSGAEMSRREGFGSGRQGRGAGRTNARTNVWQHIDGRDQSGHDHESKEVDLSGQFQHKTNSRGSDDLVEHNRNTHGSSDERGEWHMYGDRNSSRGKDSGAAGSSSSNWDRAAWQSGVGIPVADTQVKEPKQTRESHYQVDQNAQQQQGPGGMLHQKALNRNIRRILIKANTKILEEWLVLFVGLKITPLGIVGEICSVTYVALLTILPLTVRESHSRMLDLSCVLHRFQIRVSFI